MLTWASWHFYVCAHDFLIVLLSYENGNSNTSENRLNENHFTILRNISAPTLWQRIVIVLAWNKMNHVAAQ